MVDFDNSLHFMTIIDYDFMIAISTCETWPPNIPRYSLFKIGNLWCCSSLQCHKLYSNKKEKRWYLIGFPY